MTERYTDRDCWAALIRLAARERAQGIDAAVSLPPRKGGTKNWHKAMWELRFPRPNQPPQEGCHRESEQSKQSLTLGTHGGAHE